MVQMVKVTGVKAIKIAMKGADGKLAAGARVGLIKGGLYLQRESQKIVPVDVGILKNSAGTRATGQGWNTDVVVFYTATYAIYVHERKDLKHKAGKEYKYLEKPAREQRSFILKIIAKEMEI